MSRARLLGCLVVVLCAHPAAIEPAAAGNARIAVTGGASSIDGAAGGGLVPWALISGYASTREVGGSAFVSAARVDDLGLETAGFALAWEDRAELSASRQVLHVHPLDTEIRQDVVGLKLRLAGRVPYTRMPQISAGLQYRRNRDADGLPAALGAERGEDWEAYLAGSRLFFSALAGRNVLANLTLRWSRAQETGLLGFGDDREVQVEASAGLFLTDEVLLGAEYRQKPGLLPGVKTSDWKDLFVAWFPTRHVSVTAAWLDLGDVALFDDQSGWYLSVEASL